MQQDISTKRSLRRDKFWGLNEEICFKQELAAYKLSFLYEGDARALELISLYSRLSFFVHII